MIDNHSRGFRPVPKGAYQEKRGHTLHREKGSGKGIGEKSHAIKQVGAIAYPVYPRFSEVF